MELKLINCGLHRSLLAFSFFGFLFISLFSSAPAYAFKVLFIGDSLTSQSESALTQFSSASPLGGDQFTFLVVGGFSLYSHLNGGRASRVIASQPWDYVVLQDNTLQPINNNQSFHNSIDQLTALIRQRGAEPILFETWARGQGGGFANYPGYQNTVSSAYLQAGQRVGAVLARVGGAYRDLYYSNFSVFQSLYQTDLTHATKLGRWAVAASIYKVMYPTDLSWAPVFGQNINSVRAIRSAVLSNTATRAVHHNTAPPVPPPPPVEESPAVIAPILDLLLG